MAITTWAARLGLGLRAKEILAVTLLIVLVLGFATLVHLSLITRVALEDADRQAHLIARQIYAQSARSLARTDGRDPVAALRQDQELRTLLEASVEYSPQLLYAVMTDQAGRAILHSDKRKEGEVVPERPSLQTLLSLDGWSRVRALFDESQIYEAVLPVKLNGRPFAAIRIGVGLPFVRGELWSSLSQSAALASLAIVAAWGVALGLSNLALRPIRRLAQDMERLRRGEFDVGPSRGPMDDFGKLAFQLQLLGQEIHADRARMLAERTRYQHAVDQLEDGLMFCDADQRVLFVNRAAEPVLGRPAAEVAGVTVKEALDAGHPLRALVERAFHEGTDVRNASVTVPTDGSATDFLASVFLVDSGRGCEGALVLVKDLRALSVSAKTLESLIRYAARLTALGRATSELAHEVKNPLHAMTIHLRILRDEIGPPSGTGGRSLEVIQNEIGRLDAIVERFRGTVRAESVARKPVDLDAVLKDVAALLEADWKDKGVTFVLHLDPAIPAVWADEELLRAAFMNIILNACQAMEGGGTVTVASEQEGAESVRVVVTDTGPGIPPADMDKIFAPAFTTKVGGTGQGLPLARRIIEMHTGEIEVLSTVGQGTTVGVRLPVGR
ncbi:MAG TPA: ATP-binding protein [Methylomirabilota bacterium]|nr:ATP-binding protein [Methylomirabilota bacterium]